MAEKVFENVIFQQLYDTYNNWLSVNPILREGTLAIATITTGSTQEVNGVSAPQTLIKVGDGKTAYKDLPFASARATDVYPWAKAATKPSYSADEIEGLDSFIASEIQDTDTQYQIVPGSDDYTYKLQSKALGASGWTDVSTISIPQYDDTQVKTDIQSLKTLVGTTAVATQIANAINALSSVYEAKGAAATALTNAKSYTDELANGAVKTNTDAIAAIKDGDAYDSFSDVENAIDDLGTTVTNIGSAVTTLRGSDAGKSVRTIATEVANSIAASAGHLKREIVTALPSASAADADTIYMIKDASVTTGDAYKEYMLIEGSLVQIGDTSVDLSGYATNDNVAAEIAEAKDEIVGTSSDGIADKTVMGAINYSSSILNTVSNNEAANKVRDIAVDTGLKVTTDSNKVATISLDDSVVFVFKSGTAQTAKEQE